MLLTHAKHVGLFSFLYSHPYQKESQVLFLSVILNFVPFVAAFVFLAINPGNRVRPRIGAEERGKKGKYQGHRVYFSCMIRDGKDSCGEDNKG